MKDYESKNIKNVAVLGHTGAGKTEVLESILFNNKITDRFGKAVDGNSIIDSDGEEVKRLSGLQQKPALIKALEELL